MSSNNSDNSDNFYSNIADQLDSLAVQLRNGPPQPVNNYLFFDAARLSILQQMQKDNVSEYALLKKAADQSASNPFYDDSGLCSMIMYLLSGNAAYAVQAYNRLLAYVFSDVDNPAGGINMNNVREYFIEACIIYGNIKPGLNIAQQADIEKYLYQYAYLSIGDSAHITNPANKNKGGFDLTDSDQCIGQYFGLALMDKLGLLNKLNSSASWLSGNILAGANAGQSISSIKTTILHYINDLAKGGEWFESSEYNPNTTVLLALGIYSLENSNDADILAILAAWNNLLPDMANAAMCSFNSIVGNNSIMSMRSEWGDNEKIGVLNSYKEAPYLAMLTYGLNKINNNTANTIASLLGNLLIADKVDLTSGYGMPIRQRYFYFVNPYLVKSAITYPQINFSSGVGLLRYVNADGDYFEVYSPNRNYIQHEYDLMGSIRFYSGAAKEYLIDHPITYGPPPQLQGALQNSINLYGIPAMLDDPADDSSLAANSSGTQKRFVSASWDSANKYIFAECQTSGRIYNKNAWHSPASWVNQCNRRIFYIEYQDSIYVFIHDRINVIDPKIAAAQNAYSGYLRDDASAIQNAQHGKLWIWHTPVLAGLNNSKNNFYWGTPKNNVVSVYLYCPTDNININSYDESSIWQMYSSIPKDQKKFQVQINLSDKNQYDELITCIVLRGSFAPNSSIFGVNNGINFAKLGALNVWFGGNSANNNTPGDNYYINDVVSYLKV